MSIPESQLQVWSNQGAMVSSQQTHESIRTALKLYSWPSEVTYDPYLQGSYKNSTNIRGDSDVDLVVELTSVYYSNLTDEEKSQLKLTKASYTWDDFRNDVIVALTNYYGTSYVDTTGSKSIKVLPNNGRITADVVPAATYKHYEKMKLIADGITFWTIPGSQQIYNFPKLHYDNGSDKNSYQQTNGWYKPSIRMFKNARTQILELYPNLSGKFPSYFVECLLWNVPITNFSGNFRDGSQ